MAAISELKPRTSSQVVLEMPCPGCLHREVCGIRLELEAAGRDVDVDLPVLPAALRPIVTLTVDCSFFVKDKSVKLDGSARKASTRAWSPEQRTAAAEQMRARNAARAEAKAGG